MASMHSISPESSSGNSLLTRCSGDRARMPRKTNGSPYRSPIRDGASEALCIDGISRQLSDTMIEQVQIMDGAVTVTDGTLAIDRKSTRLNSSHLVISYAVFCLKKQTPR